jgi:hypothetical protein
MHQEIAEAAATIGDMSTAISCSRNYHICNRSQQLQQQLQRVNQQRAAAETPAATAGAAVAAAVATAATATHQQVKHDLHKKFAATILAGKSRFLPRGNKENNFLLLTRRR